MRRTTWYVTGSLILATSALAAPVSASRASVSKAPAGKALMTRASIGHAWPGLLMAKPAVAGLAPTTGGLTGLVASVTGAPYPGVCVTATGPAGDSGGVTHLAVSHSDGRYALAHLRPGRYRLSVENCAGTGRDSSGTALSVAWPSLPAAVTVLPGERRTLRPAIAWPTDGLGLTTGRVATTLAASGKTGSISGRVTGNGHPIAHICAVAIQTDVYPLKPPEPRATTSKTGRYVIGGLKPGSYLVVFRTGLGSCPADSNWLPQWYPFQNSPFPYSATTVLVRAGRDTARINGRLKLGGEISGVVRTKAGKPVRGICVDFYGLFGFGGVYSVNVAAVSRKAGRYALHGLFGGSYQIQFSIGCGTKGDYAPQWWRDRRSPENANSIKISGRRVVKGIDAALLPGGAITGTIRAKTAARQPLAGVCVSASEISGAAADSAEVVTAKDGRYRLAGMETGRYQVTFDPTCEGAVSAGYLPAERTVPVKAGRTHRGVDALLRLAGAISGVVRTPDGKPANACVTVFDRNADLEFTNAQGHYSVTGVPPGKYAVEFEDCADSGSLAPQWYNNRPNAGSADLVTFTAGKVTKNIDVTLHPGGTLSGFITPTKGLPNNGECVEALSQEGSLGDFESAGDETFSDGNGYYVITDLPPGLYQVSFGCPYGRYASQWFRSQPDATTADNVAIDPGVRTIVNVRLSRAGAIKGKVTDQAGHPIQDVCVNVANARNRTLIPPVNNGVMTGNGRYWIGQLKPGRYLLQFDDCDNDVYGTRWYHRANRESFATQVTVRAGRVTAGVNAVLTRGGTISGTVTGSDNKPAENLCVFAFDPAAQSFSDLFFTDARGRYQVTGLSTGRYELSFNACGPNLASVTLPKPVRVTAPRSVTGLNVKLAAGGTITGVVTGDSANPGPLGQACVIAVPTNPDGSFGEASTDDSGRYSMNGLTAGTYRVDLADPLCDSGLGIPGLAPQWFGSLVTVSAGRTTSGVSATLRPSGGIQGRVTTRSHVGVAGECVTAVPFRAGQDPASGLVPPPDVAISQPTGRYRLLDLLPGRYKIEFSTGCGDTGFTTQWWDNVASAQAARVITVRDAIVTGINAALRR